MMAQEAVPAEVANRKLHRLLVYTDAPDCTEVKSGESVQFCKAANCKSVPQRRGPEKILDIDDTGMTVEYRCQTFEVRRYCVRKNIEAKDASGVGWTPATGAMDS